MCYGFVFTNLRALDMLLEAGIFICTIHKHSQRTAKKGNLGVARVIITIHPTDRQPLQARPLSFPALFLGFMGFVIGSWAACLFRASW